MYFRTVTAERFSALHGAIMDQCLIIHGGSRRHWQSMAVIFLFMTSVMVVVTPKLAESAPVSAAGCVKMEQLTQCSDLHLYSKVQLPNLLGHQNVSQVETALRPYWHLWQKQQKTPMKVNEQLSAEVKCGNLLAPYLCYLHAPACTSLQEAIPPCRSVCLAAWQNCRALVQPWPEAWDCEQWPEGELCLDSGFTSSLPVIKPDSQITEVTYFNVDDEEESLVLPSQRTRLPGKQVDKKGKDHSTLTVIDSTNKTSQKQLTDSQVFHPKARRYDIEDLGNPFLFQGWADVQGQGAAHDYCRVIGEGPRSRFLSCALAGSDGDTHTYVSERGFEVGHRHTWFMRDMDGDGRDDYCRCFGNVVHVGLVPLKPALDPRLVFAGSNTVVWCVGEEIKARISCMKAGRHGFYGGVMQPGRQHTFRLKLPGTCYQKTYHPMMGPDNLL